MDCDVVIIIVEYDRYVSDVVCVVCGYVDDVVCVDVYVIIVLVGVYVYGVAMMEVYVVCVDV